MRYRGCWIGRLNVLGLRQAGNSRLGFEKSLSWNVGSFVQMEHGQSRRYSDSLRVLKCPTKSALQCPTKSDFDRAQQVMLRKQRHMLGRYNPKNSIDVSPTRKSSLERFSES